MTDTFPDTTTSINDFKITFAIPKKDDRITLKYLFGRIVSGKTRFSPQTMEVELCDLQKDQDSSITNRPRQLGAAGYASNDGPRRKQRKTSKKGKALSELERVRTIIGTLTTVPTTQDDVKDIHSTKM